MAVPLLLVALAMPVLPLSAALARDETALDRYVAAPDPDYDDALVSTLPGPGYTAHVLELTSQRWRTPAEVDQPIWKHWLTIVEPEHVSSDIGVLVISGGSTQGKPPAQVNPLLAFLAVTTHSVVSEVRMVPNEPLKFADEARTRKEDAITAYSWDKYLRTGDETWPIRLPMTKSAVRAMDAVTAFCRSSEGGNLAVHRFVVGGASKRGWTAWTTAAVDKRVVAIVPVVIDMLNVEPSLEHQYQAYGFWAPPLRDYEEMGIMGWRGTPQMKRLLAIEDPYAYRDRLTLPKFIVNSTGDQYFLPDSSQFYSGGLKGETYLRYVPNTDHSMRSVDAAESVIAFYQSILDDTPRPKYRWRFAADGSIRVETETRPLAVKLWQAANPAARDFRLATIGPAFRSSVLSDQGGGVYIGAVPPPKQGWVAYFVEMSFPGPGAYPFTVTTGVRVAPDVLPFAAAPTAEVNDPASRHEGGR
ncbi:MAG TPA: PhoPQ-activated pathogenicity-related family protein [Stellaceae bacterium]|nr:PhoPQ-activated pathogenicity-related family protein [Stellaceae bacterium]